MQEIFIGAAIKQRRKEKGLTQEQLCQGICEPVTISRLENGHQLPSHARISALLERLDLPKERYIALLSMDELEVKALQEKIVIHNVAFQRAKEENRKEIRKLALDTHFELEAIMAEDDMISRQLILRSKILLGREDGSRYSFEEQIEMLTEAIRLTSPGFALDKIKNGLYTVEEIKIINHLATVHGRANKHIEATSILSQLYQYICDHFKEIPVYKAHFQMIAFNYSKELLYHGQLEEAILIAEKGKAICIESGNFGLLPDLVAIIAEAKHFLGEEEESLRLYRQAFYFYQLIGNKHDGAVIQREVKEYFGLMFEN